MARKSLINRNAKRLHLIEKYSARRAELKKVLMDPSASMDAKAAALRAFAKMPRDSAKVRYRNRCALTGRSRGTFRKFGLGRNILREIAMNGEIPGVTKSSW